MTTQKETVLWFATGAIALVIAYFGMREHRLVARIEHKPTAAEKAHASANYLYMHGGYFAGIQPTTFDPDTLVNKDIQRSTSPYGIFFTG
jgi:hypothetical protein